jgi:proteic killer suppression protein
MKFRVNDRDGLRELWHKGEAAPAFRKLPNGVPEAFRKRLKFIKNATDERDLRGMKSLHYEKLERSETEYSIRLNDQWRLILEWREEADDRYLWVEGIEDYH